MQTVRLALEINDKLYYYGCTIKLKLLHKNETIKGKLLSLSIRGYDNKIWISIQKQNEEIETFSEDEFEIAED